MGVTANGYEVSFWSDEMFQNQVVMIITQLWEYAKNDSVHLKEVDFMVVKLHLNKSVF